MSQVEYSEKDYQNLFERMADAWPDGTIECEKISHMGMVLMLRYDPPTCGQQDIRCGLQLMQLDGREFVSVTQDGSFESVLVSPILSAVLAVCVR